MVEDRLQKGLRQGKELGARDPKRAVVKRIKVVYGYSGILFKAFYLEGW
jgi:hypothetical protein